MSLNKAAKSLDISSQMEEYSAKILTAKQEISKIVLGQDKVIDRSLITLLSSGHLLLIGLPGLGKTLLVDTISKVIDLKTKRIQCTPDLMPSDIIGSETIDIAKDGSRSFRFIEGPVFCQLLMADEINRASPRTQSALLQAMQEQQVTISGVQYDLPKPFHVMATQNPLEQEGTYPLPEAQLDRFLMQVEVTYPSEINERQMMLQTTGASQEKAVKIIEHKDLIAIQKLIRSIPIGDNVVDAILKLVRSARPDQSEFKNVTEFVNWGPGPRASQALMLACRAKALIEGRYAPSIDDVLELASPVLRHRMSLNFAARGENITIDSIIEEISASI